MVTRVNLCRLGSLTSFWGNFDAFGGVNLVFQVSLRTGGLWFAGVNFLPFHVPKAPSNLIKMRQQKCFIRSVWYQVCLPVSMAP